MSERWVCEWWTLGSDQHSCAASASLYVSPLCTPLLRWRLIIAAWAQLELALICLSSISLALWPDALLLHVCLCHENLHLFPSRLPSVDSWGRKWSSAPARVNTPRCGPLGSVCFPSSVYECSSSDPHATSLLTHHQWYSTPGLSPVYCMGKYRSAGARREDYQSGMWPAIRQFKLCLLCIRPSPLQNICPIAYPDLCYQAVSSYEIDKSFFQGPVNLSERARLKVFLLWVSKGTVALTWGRLSL